MFGKEFYYNNVARFIRADGTYPNQYVHTITSQ